jgi:predicted dehydrogenase
MFRSREKKACSRRSFLRSAILAGVAPYFMPRRVLGSPDIPSANERIVLGQIGIGNMGSGHLEAFLGNSDVQLVAVCDVHRDHREAAQRKVNEHYGQQTAGGSFRGCAAYLEFERLLARPDIDAVCIAVPDHWHAIIAIAACKAGKDVYCEKPLALTVRDARRMVNAARRYARVFQTGSQQRSTDKFRYACELVRNARIGKLVKINVGVGGPSHDKQFVEQAVPGAMDWERWLGPAPWSHYNEERCSGDYSGGWRHVRDYSGGMMTDWGAHHFDIAQWALGMDDSGPTDIIPPPGPPPGITTTPNPDEGQTLRYRYSNGVEMIHGGANGILFTGTDGKIEVNRGYFRTWPDSIGQQPILPSDVHLYECSDHRQNWLDCIRTRTRPIADVEIGCRSVSVCHLGNIAYWTGRHIKWDPLNEQILDDDAAAHWLDRPKRGPWRTDL